jgi:hypothetical protein
MSGTWTVARNEVAPIHTFTAPEDGWLVTSHVIELPGRFVLPIRANAIPFGLPEANSMRVIRSSTERAAKRVLSVIAPLR